MVENTVSNQTLRSTLTLENLWHDCQAVLYDFDGVLADSEPFYRKSWNSVLQEYGHTVPEADYWKYWSYLGTGLEGEISRTGLKIQDVRLAKTQQKMLYSDYCRQGLIPLFSKAMEVLSFTCSRKLCSIASNTDSDLINLIVGADLSELPPVTGGEGLRSKPAPDIFLKAAESLGVSPGECLVFEDAMKGVTAAKEAGMNVVLVRNRYNQDFPAPGASAEIQGIETILSLKER